jgi:hypothetical protein
VTRSGPPCGGSDLVLPVARRGEMLPRWRAPGGGLQSRHGCSQEDREEDSGEALGEGDSGGGAREEEGVREEGPGEEAGVPCGAAEGFRRAGASG